MSKVQKELVLENDVMQFMDKAAHYCGLRHAIDVYVEMEERCIMDMESPIERLLWVAVNCVCEINGLALNADVITVRGKDELGAGMHLQPQFKLGKYRADFCAYFVRRGTVSDKWIIECDGHEFHERTKVEREQEKVRDRFFTMSGYKLMRYTGSEIVRDPYAVAIEVIKAITGESEFHPPKYYWPT